MNFQTQIQNIFDYCYTSSNIRIPEKTCYELGKILHTAMYIEEHQNKIPAFSFSKEVLELFNGNDSDEADSKIQDFIKIYEEMNKKWLFYSDSINFCKKDIGYIIAQLNNIYLSDPNLDTFGDTLEIFRNRWAKQEGGQFFTDQKVTHLALKMLGFNPFNGDDLIDICSGTGGFLLAAFNHLREIIKKDYNGDEKLLAEIASKSLKGQEIDSEVANLANNTLTVRTGLYSSELVKNANSLESWLYRSNNSYIKENSHTCAATNPPFGAKIPVRDENILKDYELAKTVSASGKVLLKGRSPDILFIERNIKLLKPGIGRLAIIVPYQILSGPQTKYVREWMLKHCIVEAVIDLPGETFQPHTGTKTSLVLLKRREIPLLNIKDIEEYKIFMATPRWIGHDRRGKTIYITDKTGKNTNTILSDIEDIEKSFFNFKNNKTDTLYEECFIENSSLIKDDELLRLNAQSYKPSKITTSQQMSAHKTVKIKDVVKKIFYPGRFKRNYVDKYELSVPFLGGSNITEFIYETDKWFRHDDPKLESLSVKSGWLLITRSGSTGIISSVPEAWDGFALSEHIIRIIPDENLLDPFYILAYLRSKICQERLKKGVFGSVIDEISPDFIGDIEIPILDPKDMNKISNKMKEAEYSRNKAISGIKESVDLLDSLFSD